MLGTFVPEHTCRAQKAETSNCRETLAATSDIRAPVCAMWASARALTRVRTLSLTVSAGGSSPRSRVRTVFSGSAVAPASSRGGVQVRAAQASRLDESFQTLKDRVERRCVGHRSFPRLLVSRLVCARHRTLRVSSNAFNDRLPPLAIV